MWSFVRAAVGSDGGSCGPSQRQKCMGGGTSKQQQERQTPLKGVAPGSTPRNARQSPATPATNTAPSPASPGLRADLPLLDEPLDRLSVGELQVFIAEAGLDSSDLREKSELVERARCIGPLEYLKPNSLRRLLEATGQNHAHCLEKGELVDLLRDAIAAGGRGNALRRPSGRGVGGTAAPTRSDEQPPVCLNLNQALRGR